jgi:hypothetical protein
MFHCKNVFIINRQQWQHGKESSSHKRQVPRIKKLSVICQNSKKCGGLAERQFNPIAKRLNASGCYVHVTNDKTKGKTSLTLTDLNQHPSSTHSPPAIIISYGIKLFWEAYCAIIVRTGALKILMYLAAGR